MIQVKPQIETVLKLPPNALTKEIHLMQDLLTLFSQYQIPSTLVSYDGDDATTVAKKILAVKQHVNRVLDVIKSIKDEQLRAEEQQANTLRNMIDALQTMSHPMEGSSGCDYVPEDGFGCNRLS